MDQRVKVIKGYSTFPKTIWFSLMSDPGHLLVSFYSLTDMQSKYSTTQADWIKGTFKNKSRHHHDVTPSALISLTLSSGLHPISAQSFCMEFLARYPAFARACERVLRSMSLMRLSLLLQQCPSCLVLLTWIVFMMGGKWAYSCCFKGCCLQDLFNIAFFRCLEINATINMIMIYYWDKRNGSHLEHVM